MMQKLLGQLRTLRNEQHFTATRIGAPGCAVRLAAADHVWALDEAIRILAELLNDPAAVHINMLRGTIAKPTPEAIAHLYGRKALLAALNANGAGGEQSEDAERDDGNSVGGSLPSNHPLRGTDMPVKLTKAQREVLVDMNDKGPAFYRAKTIERMKLRPFVRRTDFGWYEITDLGRSLLQGGDDGR